MAQRNLTFDPVTLRLFVAVCEERNIARAASREAIVASAVSKRIGAIEAEIGAPLLVRGRRGIEPTAAGQALLRQARDVLGTMARMHAELSDFATGAQGNVRVAAAPSVLAENLAEDIGSFLQAHPKIRVSLDERISIDILRSVREGAADLGVLWDLSDLSGLAQVPYRRDRLCLVTPAGHPLARRRRIAFAEALPHVNVSAAPGGMMDNLLQREAARLGQQLVHRIQVSAMDAAARLVAAGLGPAILPREVLTLHAGQQRRLALVPLSDAWALRQFVVCVRADGSASAATRLLADALRQAGQLPAATSA